VTALLEVEHLEVHFQASRRAGDRRVVRAVDDVSFAVGTGESLGIVGESGCGKTTTARAIVRILEPAAGRISIDGTDIAHLSGGDLRALRRRVQMVFQDPYSSLNDRMTIGDIVAEPLRVQGMYRLNGMAKVHQLLEMAGLASSMVMRYPHELSGGQRQRVGIARALALSPGLLVLDEPVSALDVSIQAQILNLLMDLRDSAEMGFLFISHDQDVVRSICDRVAVMYLGRIVEQGTTAQVLDSPLHPYTEALISASPVRDPDDDRTRIVLNGDVPSPVDLPQGCRFRSRCWKADDACLVEPALTDGADGHQVACHHPRV
jgi:peptide/nickel transport system ATP-binding protein/oligopeptide transport system ATP-binding protein